MSTRVQKGGPIFKPTPKPRPQPTASVSNVAQESSDTTTTTTTTTTVTAVTAVTTAVPDVITSTRQSQSLAPAPRPQPPPAISTPDSTTGRDIDPTVVTMAALCSDTGHGRVSSKAALIQNNHAAWKTSNREKRARMKALMEAKKYGRSEEAESSTRNTNPAQGPAQEESGNGFDYSETLATSRFNVQIRIGPNGETIVDEESLFVDRNDEENTDSYTHVEESDNTKFINSGSFGKKYRGSRWSAEETELFYDAISQFGENYELISYVLPGRDRKSCKNKFKAEDKKNSNRITYCLNNRIPYDIQTLSRMTGKDFSGPTPVIRAQAPLTLAQPENVNDNAESSEMPSHLQKKSRSPAGDGNMDEEIIGDAENFDP